MDMVWCPECGQPAEVEWREFVASTGGDLEMAKVRCLQRHWFLMPAATLVEAVTSPAVDVRFH